jgi:hypothetical protein
VIQNGAFSAKGKIRYKKWVILRRCRPFNVVSDASLDLVSQKPSNHCPLEDGKGTIELGCKPPSLKFGNQRKMTPKPFLHGADLLILFGRNPMGTADDLDHTSHVGFLQQVRNELVSGATVADYDNIFAIEFSLVIP